MSLLSNIDGPQEGILDEDDCYRGDTDEQPQWVTADITDGDLVLERRTFVADE